MNSLHSHSLRIFLIRVLFALSTCPLCPISTASKVTSYSNCLISWTRDSYLSIFRLGASSIFVSNGTVNSHTRIFLVSSQITTRSGRWVEMTMCGGRVPPATVFPCMSAYTLKSPDPLSLIVWSIACRMLLWRHVYLSRRDGQWARMWCKVPVVFGQKGHLSDSLFPHL